MGSDLLPQPGLAFAVRRAQLFVRLFLPDILVKELGLQPSPFASSILELLPAVVALEAGSTRLQSNPNRLVRRTGWTWFL